MPHRARKPFLTEARRAGVCTVLALLAAAAVGCMMGAEGADGTIEEVSPSPGSAGVEISEPMVLRFNMPLDRATVTDDTVTVHCVQSGEAVPVEVQLDGASVRLTVRPASAWPSDSTVQVCLSDRVQTSAGGRISGYRVDPELEIYEAVRSRACFEFATGQGLAVRRAYLLAEDRQVLVYFSQEVDPDSIAAAAVTLVTSAGELEAEVRYSPTRNRLAVYVPEELDVALPLSVRLPGSIQTRDGQLLAVGRGETLEVRYPQTRVK